MVPPELFLLVSSRDLALMLSGTPTIDVDEWMEHTKYHGAFKRRGAAPRRRLFHRSESGGVAVSRRVAPGRLDVAAAMPSPD